MPFFKRTHNTSDKAESVVGPSGIWHPPKFSVRQYALIAAGLLILAGGVILLAASPPGGTMNGASLATCSPSPCTAGVSTTYTINVQDSPNGATIPLQFQMERPNHLVNSSSSRVPVVVTFSNDQSWVSESATGKFIVVNIPPTHSSNSGAQYADPVVYNTGVTGYPACGVSGTAQCDDDVGVQTLVQDLESCSTAHQLTTPCQNIDPTKVYASGGSRGGTMTEAVACDPLTTKLFTAVAPVSAMLYSYNSPQSSPSMTNNQTWPNCPSLFGYNADPPSAGAVTRNTDMSILWIYGDQESPFTSNTCSSSCVGPGFLVNNGNWAWGDDQVIKELLAPSMGCPLSSSDTVLASGTVSGMSGQVIQHLYAPCSIPVRALSTIEVTNGPHIPEGSTADGVAFAPVIWNFFSQYGGAYTPSDTTAPTVSVSAPTGSATVSGTVPLTASASDNVGVAGVQFKLNGSNLGGPVTSSPYTMSWDTTGVANGTYALTAVASDAAGNSTTSGSVTVVVNNKVADIAAPSVPQKLSATAPSSAEVDLSWSVSTDNVGVVSYKIYRNGSTSAYATVNAPTTTYRDTAVSAGTTYTYAVTALDAAGNQSAQSISASAKTKPKVAADTTPPTVPTNLSAKVTGQTTSSLTWGPSVDTGGSGLAGYHIYRNGSLLASQAGTTFNDSGLVAGTTYAYAVSAYDNAANGSVAASIQVTTPGTEANNTVENLKWNAGSKTLTWTAYPGANSYTVVIVLNPTTSHKTIYLSSVAGTSFSPPTLSNQTVSYSVLPNTTADKHPTVSSSAEASGVTITWFKDSVAPSAPENLHSVSSAKTTTSITLRWDASRDNKGGTGLAGYHLYRNNTLIASPTTNSYTDSKGLKAGTAYHYKVKAYDRVGNVSDFSKTTSATTRHRGILGLLLLGN